MIAGKGSSHGFALSAAMIPGLLAAKSLYQRRIITGTSNTIHSASYECSGEQAPHHAQLRMG
jgi:hypothetical protein